MSDFKIRLTKDCPWCHQPRNLKDDNKKLRETMTEIMRRLDLNIEAMRGGGDDSLYWQAEIQMLSNIAREALEESP